MTSCSFLSQDVLIAPVVNLTDEPIPVSGYHVVAKGETLYEIAWRYGKDFRDIAAMNHIASPFVIYPNQKLYLNAPLPQPKQRKPKVFTTIVQKTGQQIWEWPVKGKVIKSYSLKEASMNKGVDIAGVQGMPVKAASDGKVVYSGSALRGYGQLVIIKHSDVYLSAYAHNHQLLVKEGETIKKGQIIAKMGKTDTDSVKLHFEIRQNGKPVDPLTLLPQMS